MIMKKVLAILLAVLCCFSITGCGSSISKESIKQLEKAIGGHVEQQRTTTCPKCEGDGVCSHCKGEPFRDGRRCSVCDGTGKCTRCDGKGRLDVVVIDGKDYIRCSRCRGSGINPVWEKNKDNKEIHWSHVFTGSSGDVTKCPSCSGTGWVRLYGF